MAVSLVLPVPLALRRRRARHRAAVLAFATVLAGAVTPLAAMLLPVLAAWAWRAGAWRASAWRVATGCALAVLPCAWAWSTPRALVDYPATLAGPWIALLVGGVAATTAWAASGTKQPRDMARAVAALALLCLPWSPLPALLMLIACVPMAIRPGRPAAANDNRPGVRVTLPCYPRPAPAPAAPFLTHPPHRTAQPAACD